MAASVLLPPYAQYFGIQVPAEQFPKLHVYVSMLAGSGKSN